MASQSERPTLEIPVEGVAELRPSSPLEVRSIVSEDYKQVSALAKKNFNGPSFSLFPPDVVRAYVAANRVEDLRHAAETEGSEAYVAEDEHNAIVGFVLLRHNQVVRRNAYGEVDLRRLHVDPTVQGKGIGTALFDILESRGRDLNASHITSHASGGSRPFFEAHGWEGETTFNDMTKRGRTRAIVFAGSKQLTPREIELAPTPTHLIYAGANERKAKFVRELAEGVDKGINFIQYSGAQEDEVTTDVVKAAISKAASTARQIRGNGGNFSSLIVAGDVRSDLLIINGSKESFRYDFLNRGKPRGQSDDEKIDEVADNFTELLITAEETKRPAPYVVRSATCILDPKDPEALKISTYDTSIWLSKEGLEELATKAGVRRYREDAMNLVDADVLDMSGGLCLPLFLERGYVVGINGHPIDTLAKKETVIKKALHTAIVGIDPKAIRNRLGIIE